MNGFRRGMQTDLSCRRRGGIACAFFWGGGTRFRGEKNSMDWYIHRLYIHEWNWAWVRSTASEHTPFSQSLGISDLS